MMIASFPNTTSGGGKEDVGEKKNTKKEPHKPHAGACSTWIDDEIEMMPEELQNVMPRPSCCEKDEAEQREASRLIKILKGVDRVQLKADAKAQFIVGDDAHQQQQQQFLLLQQQQQLQQQQTNEDEDEDSDFGNTDDEDEESDPYLRELKAARIREMRLNAMKAEQMQKQAEYVNARERDLGDILKKNAKVLCHFTLDGVDECARIDEVLDNLAKAFPKTKFVRIRPELGSKSPTLQMCNVSQPPAIVYFKNRRLSSWTNGFDQFGGRNGFSEESVTKYIAGIGALPGHPDAPRRNSGAKGSREEDEYAYFDSEINASVAAGNCAGETGFITFNVVQTIPVYMVNAPAKCVANRYGLTRGTSNFCSSVCFNPLFTIHHPIMPCVAPRTKNTPNRLMSLLVMYPL